MDFATLVPVIRRLALEAGDRILASMTAPISR